MCLATFKYFQTLIGIMDRLSLVDLPYDCDLTMSLSVAILRDYTTRTKVLRDGWSFAPYRV